MQTLFIVLHCELSNSKNRNTHFYTRTNNLHLRMDTITKIFRDGKFSCCYAHHWMGCLVCSVWHRHWTYNFHMIFHVRKRARVCVCLYAAYVHYLISATMTLLCISKWKMVFFFFRIVIGEHYSIMGTCCVIPCILHLFYIMWTFYDLDISCWYLFLNWEILLSSLICFVQFQTMFSNTPCWRTISMSPHWTGAYYKHIELQWRACSINLVSTTKNWCRRIRVLVLRRSAHYCFI